MWLDSVEQRPALYNLQYFQWQGRGERLENRDRTSADETKTKSGLYSNSFTSSLFHLFVAAKRSLASNTPLQDHTVLWLAWIIFSYCCAVFTLTLSVLTS